MEDLYETRYHRLLALLDALGRGGRARIAEATGLAPDYVARMAYPPGKKGRKRIGEDTAILLDSTFPGWKLSSGWLGAAGRKTDKQTFDENAIDVQGGVRSYPVISPIQAGRLTEMTTPYAAGAGFDVEYGDSDASEWAFFLEIKGKSMEPEFIEGDRVRIDPEVLPRPGDYVAARNTKEEATFKKYRVRGIDEQGNEVFELVPLNPDFPVLCSNEMKLKIIGTMTEHRRKYRRKKS